MSLCLTRSFSHASVHRRRRLKEKVAQAHCLLRMNTYMEGSDPEGVKGHTPRPLLSQLLFPPHTHTILCSFWRCPEAPPPARTRWPAASPTTPAAPPPTPHERRPSTRPSRPRPNRPAPTRTTSSQTRWWSASSSPTCNRR